MAGRLPRCSPTPRNEGRSLAGHRTRGAGRGLRHRPRCAALARGARAGLAAFTDCSRFTRRCRRPSQSWRTRGRGSRPRSRRPTSIAGVQRAARALGREMRLPGFRKGKVPPKLVLQQIGFGTGVRAGPARLAAGVVRAGRPRLGPQHGRRPRDRDHLGARGGGPAARLQVRGAGAPAGEARRLQGPRGRKGRPRGARGRDRAGARADTGEHGAAGAGGAGRGRGRRPPDRLRRHDRRRAVRGRRGPRPAARARCRAVHRGLRGAADRRRARTATTRSTSPSPRTTAPSSWRARRPASRSRSRRSGRRSCPSSTTTSPPRPPSSTPSTSCAPTSPRSSRRPPRRGSSGTSAWRRSTPPPTPRRSRSRMRSSTPEPRSDGRASSASSPAAG